MRGITHLPLGIAEPEEQLGPAPRIVGRGPVQQIERIPVPAQRLVGCEQRQRPIARPLRVRHRLAWVRRLGRLGPVVGELSRSDRPGSSPQISSSASATARCARPRRPEERPS